MGAFSDRRYRLLNREGRVPSEGPPFRGQHMAIVETPFLKEPKNGFEFLKNLSIEEFMAVTRRLRVGYSEGGLLDTAYGSEDGWIAVSFFQPVAPGVTKDEWLEIGP